MTAVLPAPRASSKAASGPFSPTLGLEEEVFVLYGGERAGYRTSLASFGGLARLLWQDLGNPGGTASNFRRGRPALRELMSSVEISTPVCDSPGALVESALARRRALCAALPQGLMLPLGLLPDSDAYHTAGLHLHVGVPEEQLARAYGNIARFLPVLAHASASSPWWQGHDVWGPGRAGPLSRVAHSFALGPLTPDPLPRFQDLIVTRRLRTIELRVLDPVWDPVRLRAIVDAAWRLAAHPEALPWSRAEYNRLREGYSAPPGEEIWALAGELQRLTGFDPGWLSPTAAEQVRASWRQRGEAATWRALDGAYRRGAWGDVGTPHARPAPWRGAAGFAAYYLPKLPYMARKVRAEHHQPWTGAPLDIPDRPA